MPQWIWIAPLCFTEFAAQAVSGASPLVAAALLHLAEFVKITLPAELFDGTIACCVLEVIHGLNAIVTTIGGIDTRDPIQRRGPGVEARDEPYQCGEAWPR